MKSFSRAALPLAMALLMVAVGAAPGGANGALPDLPEPAGAASATFVNFEIVNPELGGPALCAIYLKDGGHGSVHGWQYCQNPAGTFSDSFAGTIHFIDDPANPGPSRCNTARREFLGAEIQVVVPANDVIELGGDQGDIGDFFPSQDEFMQEVCVFDWTWTESNAEPLRRFW